MSHLRQQVGADQLAYGLLGRPVKAGGAGVMDPHRGPLVARSRGVLRQALIDRLDDPFIVIPLKFLPAVGAGDQNATDILRFQGLGQGVKTLVGDLCEAQVFRGLGTAVQDQAKIGNCLPQVIINPEDRVWELACQRTPGKKDRVASRWQRRCGQ